MSIDPATGTQVHNKRVRYDLTASIPSGKMAARQSPKQRAEAYICAHTASLQPEIANILQKLGLKNLQILHRMYNKKKQIDRMDEDE